MYNILNVTNALLCKYIRQGQTSKTNNQKQNTVLWNFKVGVSLLAASHKRRSLCSWKYIIQNRLQHNIFFIL